MGYVRVGCMCGAGWVCAMMSGDARVRVQVRACGCVRARWATMGDVRYVGARAGAMGARVRQAMMRRCVGAVRVWCDGYGASVRMTMIMRAGYGSYGWVRFMTVGCVSKWDAGVLVR